MVLIEPLIGFLANLDTHLNSVIQTYGLLTYAILFIIIFLETGVVVTPFLPGDSLLFVAGALAASGSLDVILLFGLLTIAAIAGDTANYWIGHYGGRRLFEKDRKFKIKEPRLPNCSTF